MAACGFVHEVIATCIGKDGIDPKTLRKHFRRELDTAEALANSIVGNVAFQAACRGEAWAVCFWLKCRAGWKETQKFEHSGKDGGDIALNVGFKELITSRIDSIRAARGRARTDKSAE